MRLLSILLTSKSDNDSIICILVLVAPLLDAGKSSFNLLAFLDAVYLT